MTHWAAHTHRAASLRVIRSQNTHYRSACLMGPQCYGDRASCWYNLHMKQKFARVIKITAGDSKFNCSPIYLCRHCEGVTSKNASLTKLQHSNHHSLTCNPSPITSSYGKRLLMTVLHTCIQVGIVKE